jgi:hypothetical protein
MIAAYADPWVVFCLTISTALDHGCTPLAAASCWPFGSAAIAPVSEVTRTVMLPVLPRGRCTK